MKKHNQEKFINGILKKTLGLVQLENKAGKTGGSLEQAEGSQKIEYQNDYSYLMADPRISFIKNLLRLIFSKRNIKDPPFAFRLRKLTAWLGRTNISTLLSQMSWGCKADCVFCLQKGNPPFMRFKRRMSREEIMTRLKYFDAKNNTGLISGWVYEADECLNNPYIFSALKKIRERNKRELLLLNTNGSSLRPEMVKRLAEYRPIFITLSLNSADPETRKKLMNDPRPEIAIASLALLNKHKIPFAVSLVPWPGLSFTDIKKTIAYAQANKAYFVRLYLPGYSKYFSRRKLFAARENWAATVNYFYPVLKNYKVPVLIFPNLLVQNIVHQGKESAEVAGTIINSPAAQSGIKPGDLIAKINNQPIFSIEEAMKTLSQNVNGRIKVGLIRGGKYFNKSIKDAPENHYPYGESELKRFDPFGFVFAERYFSPADITDIDRYIAVYDAKNIMVLTSETAKPMIKNRLENTAAKRKRLKLRLIAVKSRYYGGTINACDLLVVEDFIRAIKENIKEHRPDLIILPASPFNSWGRDLAGRLNLEIEREVGIPVEFVYNNREIKYI